MSMRKAFICLHTAILLAGGTGLFGRLITLTELPLVWYRMMFALILLIPILWFRGQFPRLPLRQLCEIAGCGMLLAVHWIFFYGSIQASNVSIGVICLTLVSCFTAILEPLLTKSKPRWIELLLSMLPVLGIVLIFQLDVRYRTGILLGIASSAACAFFSIGSKVLMNKHGHSSSTMLYGELVGGVALLTAVMPFVSWLKPELPIVPEMSDFVYLLLLASVFTIGAFLLQLKSLQKVSTFTMTLSYNLEPVYSILYAMILFDEGRELDRSFWIGVLLIIISVLLQTILATKGRRKKVAQA